MKKRWILLIIIFLILISLTARQLTAVHNAETSQLQSGHTRTKDEIRSKWQDYQARFLGDPYLEKPLASYPYKVGKLDPAFIEDGVNMANFVRYLADLPDDLETDPVLNNQAQYGAVLLAANKSLSHQPQKPDDMSKNFYDIGLNTCKRSNIASGIYSLSDAVIGYMMDFGDANLENVGHRRWILNPQMKTIGFGYCEGYSTMKVLNEDRRGKIDYDYITYPTEGYFPSQLFYADCCPYGSNPWSIILNPLVYDSNKLSDIRVQLENTRTSRIWSFCPKNEHSSCGKYFKIDTSDCGVPFCIIFRPDEIYDYQDGDQYQVRVTGLYTIEGEEREIEYSVVFFDL